MPRTLIIGYGNPLRGDDGVGWYAAERLRETNRNPDVEILALHQLTPELMESIGRAERVLFIDAAAAGEPGTIQRRSIVSDNTAAAFTHFATPGALLAGARVLYGRVPEATLYTVAGQWFDHSESLSGRVHEGLQLLVQQLRLVIEPEPALPPR